MHQIPDKDRNSIPHSGILIRWVNSRIQKDALEIYQDWLYKSLVLHRFPETQMTPSTLIQIGDYYEDCAYHPCLCIHAEGDEIMGISLVDGSFPRICSLRHCGIVPLNYKQAIYSKFKLLKEERQTDEPAESKSDLQSHFVEKFIEIYKPI